MASTRWVNGAVTGIDMQNLLRPQTRILGQRPQTLDMPVFDTPQEAFIIASEHTPAGQRLLGTSRKAGRYLAIVATVLCLAGITAEIACILAAVSGAQQAAKLDWPLANTPSSWDKCEFLPNSDAPATSYGAGIAVLYHSLNVAVFAGMITFLMRYAKTPKALYGISTAGLFQFWLGLGLASRWLGTLQLVGERARASLNNELLLSFCPVGMLLIISGLLDFMFGFHYFKKAVSMAFIPIHILRVRAEKEEQAHEEKMKAEEVKLEAERDTNIWRGTVEQAMKQLQAYRPFED